MTEITYCRGGSCCCLHCGEMCMPVAFHASTLSAVKSAGQRIYWSSSQRMTSLWTSWLGVRLKWRNRSRLSVVTYFLSSTLLLLV